MKLLLTLLLFSVSQIYAVPSQWTKEEYPNPQINFVECGRESASWVCDPNGILSKNTSNKLDSIFQHIQDSLSPNYHCNSIALGVANEMKTPTNETPRIYSNEFSSFLYSKWIEKEYCENGMVIFFSKVDRSISIHIGEGIKKLFRDDAIQLLITNMQSLNVLGFNVGKYDDAFLESALEIENIFKTVVIDVYIMYAGILLLIVLCLFGFLYVVKTYKSSIELQNFSSLEPKETIGESNDYRSSQIKLLYQRLLELERQIKNNCFDTCPVCFTEYDLCITRTLPCKHTYCVKCYDTNTSKCPICSLQNVPVDEKELQFRLWSLTIKFPDYLTIDFLSRCNRAYFNEGTWTLDWKV